MVTLFCVFGSALRVLYTINGRSLWGDEWMSLSHAKGSLGSLFTFSFFDNHPPLYFLLLKLSVVLLGFNESAFRFPSLSAGLGVFAFAYLISRELFDKKAALISLILVSLLPYFIHLSAEIRNHGLPIFFCAAGTYFFLKALKEPKDIRWGRLYAASVVGAVYTEHFAWFWLGALLSAHFFEIRKGEQNPGTLKIHRVPLLLCLPALTLLGVHLFAGNNALAFSWAEISNYPLILLRKILNIYWRTVTGHLFDLEWKNKILFYFQTSPLFWGVFIIYGVSLVLVALAFLKLKFRLKIFFLLLIVAVPMVVAVTNSTRLDPRFFGVSALFFVILLSYAISQLPRFQKWAVLGALCAIAGLGDYHILGLSTDPNFQDDFQEMVLFAGHSARSNDALCTNNGLVEYYLSKWDLPKKAKHIGFDDLKNQGLGAFNEVWILNGPDNERYDEFVLFCDELRRKYPHLKERELVFGDPEGLAIAKILTYPRRTAESLTAQPPDAPLRSSGGPREN